MWRKRPRRNRRCQIRVQRPQPTRTNESWRMDFMADQLFSGQRFRILTLVNNFRRESLAIRVGQRLTGDHVVETLQAVTMQRGHPETVRVDHGPEFISESLG